LQNERRATLGRLAQLVRAFRLHRKGRGFESLSGHKPIFSPDFLLNCITLDISTFFDIISSICFLSLLNDDSANNLNNEKENMKTGSEYLRSFSPDDAMGSASPSQPNDKPTPEVVSKFEFSGVRTFSAKRPEDLKDTHQSKEQESKFPLGLVVVLEDERDQIEMIRIVLEQTLPPEIVISTPKLEELGMNSAKKWAKEHPTLGALILSDVQMSRLTGNDVHSLFDESLPNLRVLRWSASDKYKNHPEVLFKGDYLTNLSAETARETFRKLREHISKLFDLPA
jgi:hypothetical protein